MHYSNWASHPPCITYIVRETAPKHTLFFSTLKWDRLLHDASKTLHLCPMCWHVSECSRMHTAWLCVDRCKSVIGYTCDSIVLCVDGCLCVKWYRGCQYLWKWNTDRQMHQHGPGFWQVSECCLYLPSVLTSVRVLYLSCLLISVRVLHLSCVLTIVRVMCNADMITLSCALMDVRLF